MSYTETERRSDLNIKQDDMLASKRFVIERKPDTSYFYELEEAVVLDIILDDKHPAFTDELDANDFPPNIDGSEPVSGTSDYGQIGAIKFRFLNSERGKDKEQLGWAYPIENTGITEWPLMNEMVIVGRYMESYFYSRKLNFKSVVNSNASFITERVSGWVDQNTDEYNNGEPYTGPKSTMNFAGGDNYTGVLGDYFKFNPKIRSLKRYEGDTILESRFGSSIRFGAYDDNRNNDSGIEGEYEDGGGNPKILLRNRQAPIKNPEGFTAKGYTEEDINKDGSSVHITSGKTISKFQPTTTNAIIRGNKPVSLPKLDGDQIVINSDRLVFSSKADEMFFFSKKKIGMTSDDAISISCVDRMTLTALKTATINSPKIYLGDHGKTYEPALLGRSTVAWMYSMCDWMLLNVNTQIQVLMALQAHLHLTKTGPTLLPILPPASVLWAEQLLSLQASQISLLALRSQLSSLMSGRVFVAGGVD
jgi:hypothetical protein